jgi:hypothetical protein
MMRRGKVSASCGQLCALVSADTATSHPPAALGSRLSRGLNAHEEQLRRMRERFNVIRGGGAV